MNKVNVASLILRSFYSLFERVMSGRGGEFWLKGGRGSTKSSFISVCFILLLLSNPLYNGVVVRRFSNTLRDSVYAQMCWAIAQLGLSGWFIFHKSPMEIIYKPTGQKILFRGLDDPTKEKGVKFETGYCALVWFEELDQFESWEKVRSALKSYRRGGDKFWTFYSYNPPKTLWSWVNRQALEMERKPGCTVHHSSYLDVVEGGHIDWLGQDFVDEAEWLKQTNETAYRWEMLGEITGTGGSVFENLVNRPITQEEIYTFDNPRNGIDFGWFPDPWRFIRCEYQAHERRLIIFDEHSANKQLPRDTGETIVKALTYADSPGGNKYLHNQAIWCDDTPDGKTHMGVYRREFGLNTRPAKKGNMRKLSYEWLASLREIVIDPNRCPLTYEEFALCEYEKDKEGNWIDEYPDGHDHSIDAVRYAMMNDAIRGR